MDGQWNISRPLGAAEETYSAQTEVETIGQMDKRKTGSSGGRTDELSLGPTYTLKRTI